MEVDAVQVNNIVDCFEDEADEQSLSPEGSDAYNVFGDPDIFPRVGEQYQVEIPPLISESDYRFQKNPCDPESTAGNPHESLVGLPIPIIWIQGEVRQEDACKFIGVTSNVEYSKPGCIKKSQNSLDNNEPPTPEAIDSTLIKTTKLGESGNSSVQQATKIEVHGKHEGKGICLVPGSSSDTWNEIEEASFTLGLYIFGKNLVQVKRFFGNKNMGDILSFYYGKFYKTDRYHRWSECRKVRSRKCIYGQKIFTGARQQELFSRLLPNVSEECRNNLLKVSKAFTEGKMLLEDYVLSLKALVGLSALIQAVGVGKGTEDLTGLNADSLKPTQTLPVRPEIPVGKACSMLSPEEIITFLTGDFRLSKARSSDLFWEAVWPRLLARGWHSEQPGSHNYAISSKNSLVFLVPGVEKFSRKLVKGNHYFNSVSDVLGKVASDPELIELDPAAENDCTSKEGNGWSKETNLDRESSPDQQRHCYLKPRTPNRSTNVRKFTIVDTSMTVEKTTKIRELRSLPFGVLETSLSENDSDNKETSEDQTTESDSVNTMCSFRKKVDFTKATKCSIGKIVSSDINGVKNNPSREYLPVSVIGSTNLSAAFKDEQTDLLNNARRKAMKCQSKWGLVPDKKNVLIPVTKRRRRLTACSRAERNGNITNIFVAPRVKPEEASCHRDNSKSSEIFSLENPAQENKMLADLPPREKKTLADPLSNGSSNISREAVPDASSSATEEQSKKSLPRTMIDLNLPVSPEVEGDESFVIEMSETQQNNARKELDDHSARPIFQPGDNSQHQPEMNTRRQSTRNRPLTTKVLEAFASGYLDRKEKRKSRDYPCDSSISRPSRRARNKVIGEFTNSNGPNFQEEERANGMFDDSGKGKGNDNVVRTCFKCYEG